MTVEYIVGSFLHETEIVKHHIPEEQTLINTEEKQWFECRVKRRDNKKSEWSTLRQSKYL